MYIDPRWIIVVVLSSLVYGLLSPIIAARRLLFLAGSLPHSALLSVILSVILANTLGGSLSVWAVIISIILVYTVAFMLSRGISGDTATAVFVSFSVSLTVISMYYVITRYALATSLWAYILGDPLLVTWSDTYYAIIVSSITLILIVPFLREHILIGIDRDFVRLSGVNTVLYDVALMTALAIATVGLLKIVGFVIEHVLLLLPGIIASSIARGGSKAVVVAVLVSLLGGISGLFLGLYMGLAPSGSIGLILLLLYIIVLFRRGVIHG